MLPLPGVVGHMWSSVAGSLHGRLHIYRVVLPGVCVVDHMYFQEPVWSIIFGEVLLGVCVVNHMWSSVAGNMRGLSNVEKYCQESAWSIICGAVLLGDVWSII